MKKGKKQQRKKDVRNWIRAMKAQRLKDAENWALLCVYLALQGWQIEGITPESVSEFVRSATRDMKRRSDMDIVVHYCGGKRYTFDDPKTEATE